MSKDWISTSALYGSHLSHHGILGQKWGIRRYQNEDGTLTQAGKERYNTRQEYISKYSGIIDSRKSDLDYNAKVLKRAKKDMWPSDSIHRLEESINENRRTIRSYEKRIEEIKNTPINKKVSHERISSGKKKALAALVAGGAATATAVGLSANSGVSIGRMFTIGLISSLATYSIYDIIDKNTLNKEQKYFDD